MTREPKQLGWLGGCAAAAIALAACSSGAGGPPPTAAPTTAVAKTTASGCGKPASAGTSILSVDVGGHNRVVAVHIPTGYTGTQHVPLVLNMHGSGSNAAEQEGLTDMDATADAHGFIVAYPQGVIPAGSGYDWNVPNEPLFGGAAVPKGSPDDVAFLTSLVGTLGGRYCLNDKMIYATGISAGARMASQLAGDSSGVFAAIAAVSGLRHPTPCPASRPVPVIAFHGTADPIDPYDGHGQAYWTYSVPQAAADWGAQDGCAASPSVSHPVETVTLTTYTGCRADASVELYTISGEGHEWPGGPHLRRKITRVLGPQTTAISANDLMWSFFVSHPLP